MIKPDVISVKLSAEFYVYLHVWLTYIFNHIQTHRIREKGKSLHRLFFSHRKTIDTRTLKCVKSNSHRIWLQTNALLVPTSTEIGSTNHIDSRFTYWHVIIISDEDKANRNGGILNLDDKTIYIIFKKESATESCEGLLARMVIGRVWQLFSLMNDLNPVSVTCACQSTYYTCTVA